MMKKLLLPCIALSLSTFAPQAKAQSEILDLLSSDDSPSTPSGTEDSSELENRFDLLPWKGSLFYESEDLQAAYAAILEYEARQNTIKNSIADNEDGLGGMNDDFGSNFSSNDSFSGNIRDILSPGNAQKAAELAKGAAKGAKDAIGANLPTFYLKSIIYQSPNNWTFWLNDDRYTENSIPDDFKIIDVREDEVVLLWQTSKLSAVGAGWNKGFKKIETENSRNLKSRLEALNAQLTREYNEFFTKQNRARFLEKKKADFLARQEANWRENQGDDTFNVPTNDQVRAWERQWRKRAKKGAEKEWETMRIERQQSIATQVRTAQKKMMTDIKRKELIALAKDEYIWDHVSEDDSIYVNSLTGAVQIALGTNQTFMASDLAVLEGDHYNVSISNKAGNLVKDMLATDSAVGQNVNKIADQLRNVIKK